LKNKGCFAFSVSDGRGRLKIEIQGMAIALTFHSHCTKTISSKTELEEDIMLTDNCDEITLDTSSPEGIKLWRCLCTLVRHTGVNAPARYYRNKLVSEGLTSLERQEAWEMLDEWGY
jgi:hypothetical protein